MSQPETLTVRFRSLGRSAREWDARFDLGSRDANALCALRHAHNMNASIVSHSERAA